MNVVLGNTEGELKKQVTKVMNENMLLQQKCQILEIKLKEAEERNQNIQKMNGTIMNVLNDLNSNQQNHKQISELIKAQDGYNSKLLYLNDKIKQLELANKTLQQQLQESVIQNNQLNQRISQLQDSHSGLLKQIGAAESQLKQYTKHNLGLNTEKCSLENQLEEKDFEIQKNRFELEVRIEELSEENQKLKDELRSMMGQILRRTQSQFSNYHQSPDVQRTIDFDQTEITRQRTNNNTITKSNNKILKVTPKKTLWK